ncbi:MAG: hypothetical protein QXS66_07110 [Thermoproteota archaeon]|nr:hypothetical protein [Candidatus Brockarchaeota archaeon]
MTGQNLEEYWFDIMQRDLKKGRLFFIGGAKSQWKEWRPNSMLRDAIKDLKNHLELEDIGDLKLPVKGYVFAIHVIQEGIEIWWQEVDLSSIGG